MLTSDVSKWVSVGQQHSNIEIIRDMLRAGKNGSVSIQVSNTADISYPQIRKYLECLINEGFINRVNLDDTMVAYQVTEIGLKFLKAIDTLLDMIESTRDSD